MPIDPNIPLDVNANIPLQAGKPSGPFGPDLRSLMTMQELAQRMQVVSQAQKDQNALQQVFSQTGNIDEKSGYLTPQGLKQLAENAPGHYADYIQKAAVGQERQLRNTALQGELWNNFLAHGYLGAKAALKVYEENLKYGVEAAERAKKKALYDNWTEAGKMGFPPNWISSEPMDPHVTALRTGIAGYEAANAKLPPAITPYQQEKLGIDKEKDYKIMVLQQENKFLKENV